MASIAIGDIHGNIAALDDLLLQLEPTLTSTDTVVFLGDYIDRGAHSREVVDRILGFQRGAPASVVTLLGNHEYWLLKSMRDYRCHSWLLATDAYSTIESYSPRAAAVLRAAAAELNRDALYGGTEALPYDVFFCDLPTGHQQFFEKLLFFYETDDAVFVHAGVDAKVRSLAQQSQFTLLMGSFEFPNRYAGPRLVVYGHHDNAQLRDGWPHPDISDYAIGIDTIAHGVLTAVTLPSRSIVQSSRHLD